jgi:hypothetical protein
MTKTNVNRTTLMSGVHNNIFDTINERSNVVDAKNPNNLFRKFVYKNDPWSKGNYDGYPYVIVRFPNITKVKESQSADGNVKNIEWTCEVTVRTAMGGAINDDESVGVTDMNSICDDLHETFDSKSVKDELRAYGMNFLNVDQVGNDELVDSNGKHVFESVFEISCMNRIKVGV